MEICIVAGARPNFMKVAPIIRMIKTLQKQGQDIGFTLVYTGKKDDSSLEKDLFNDLSIAPPTVFLGVDCENLNELTGQVMSQFEHYLQHHPTDIVIVVDDLASTMATSIVTKKQGICLAHIAAGTRSFDISMPKEINRLVIDGLSDILFTAGISNNSIANREGAELSKVYMVGNILIDNLRYNRDHLQRPTLFDELKLKEKEYLVFTLNRKALIAHQENLGNMIETLLKAAGKTPIVAPLRESAAKAVREIAKARQWNMEHFYVVNPLSYLQFGYLTAHAHGIITDSGNVAEEATFNQVPCITLNSYTEHIETVTIGTNVLVGEDPKKLLEAVHNMVSGNWKSAGLPDRWDGRSGERIVQTLISAVRERNIQKVHSN